jgi:hypothetical protein
LQAFNDKSRKIQIFVAKKDLNYRFSKWLNWEFFPWWLANIPVYGFYAWFALRARHLFFFTNVNPDIPLGGAMGESKIDILNLLPKEIVPRAVVVQAHQTFEETLKAMQSAGLEFPIIAKPDVGERGFLVKKIEDTTELAAHLSRYKVDFILQEFLHLPIEMTVLFHRYPGQTQVKISSVCEKAFLSVSGDGISSIRVLMGRELRAALQLPRFEKEQAALLDLVPAKGENFLLEPIGNHVRGTKFLNGNHYIDQPLIDTISVVCSQMPGILYGRFDLKCASIEALKQGDFKVMELNGVLGEPAHVYDPEFGMWRAYRDLYLHWRILFRLHRAQKRSGVSPASHRASWKLIQQYFRYKKALEAV